MHTLTVVATGRADRNKLGFTYCSDCAVLFHSLQPVVDFVRHDAASTGEASDVEG
jgi:hypothetical protein